MSELLSMESEVQAEDRPDEVSGKGLEENIEPEFLPETCLIHTSRKGNCHDLSWWHLPNRKPNWWVYFLAIVVFLSGIPAYLAIMNSADNGSEDTGNQEKLLPIPWLTDGMVAVAAVGVLVICIGQTLQVLAHGRSERKGWGRVDGSGKLLGATGCLIGLTPALYVTFPQILEVHSWIIVVLMVVLALASLVLMLCSDRKDADTESVWTRRKNWKRQQNRLLKELRLSDQDKKREEREKSRAKKAKEAAIRLLENDPVAQKYSSLNSRASEEGAG